MANDVIIRNDIFSIIIILGIVQGTFLAYFFILRGCKGRVVNIYLGIILLLFVIHNLDFWATYSRFVLKAPYLLDISVSFTMAIGPLIYHYIRRSLINKPDSYFYLHYILFLFFFLYSLFFVLQPDVFKYNVFIISRSIDLPLKEVVLNHSFDPLGLRSRADLLISAQLIVYLLLSYYIFNKHLKNNNIKFFGAADAVISWLRNLLLASTVIILVAVIIQVLFSGGKVEYLLATCFTAFIYFISFNLLRGSAFLDQTLFPEKYLKSGLTEQMKIEYKKKIEQLMIEEKPYLNNLFSLNKLSKITGIPANQISQILNESFHQTFFEFLRHFRILEAKQLISKPENSGINIEEIAYMVGYNSKSAFNKAFLGITGETPLSFKKKNIR
jgi:AraC-like DNA-binding protein